MNSSSKKEFTKKTFSDIIKSIVEYRVRQKDTSGSEGHWEDYQPELVFVSQCSGCVFQQTIKECDIYIKKPDTVITNEEVCKYKKVEGE